MQSISITIYTSDLQRHEELNINRFIRCSVYNHPSNYQYPHIAIGHRKYLLHLARSSSNKYRYIDKEAVKKIVISEK